MKIILNNVEYTIDESTLASSNTKLQSHITTVMNGSGSTINLGDTTYNVDLAKFTTALNSFVSYLGTISGNGAKVVVDGVEYAIDSTKIASAVSELENTFSQFNVKKVAVKSSHIGKKKIYINTSLSKEEVTNILSNSDINYTRTSYHGAYDACYFVYMTFEPEPQDTYLYRSYNMLYLHDVFGRHTEYRIVFKTPGSVEIEIFNSVTGWVNTELFLNEDGSIKDEFVSGRREPVTMHGSFNDALVYVENDKLTDLIYVQQPVTNNTGGIVPREGYVDKIEFNIDLSVEEVNNILSQLEYDETGTVYILTTDFMGISAGMIGDGMYMIADMANMGNPIFTPDGWNPDFNGQIIVGADVLPEFYGWDWNGDYIEWGTQNDKLVDLVYIP